MIFNNIDILWFKWITKKTLLLSTGKEKDFLLWSLTNTLISKISNKKLNLWLENGKTH